MKLVVTILQCHRVALPHIFLAHVLPKMRREFPGQIEAIVVQHRADASGGPTALESLQTGGAREKLARVRQWTDDGRFEGATILAHDIVHRPYPTIPSVHRAVQAALERNADFHLWLEDDALVDDPDCARWDEMLGPCEVGVYARSPEILHPAFLLTRPSFDERIACALADYDSWVWGPRRLEPFLRRHLRTPRALLRRSAAVRYHHRYYPYTGLRYVVDAVRRIAPEALPLLDIDFGDGASRQPPITEEELRQHERGDHGGIVRALWRLRESFLEEPWLIRS